MLRIAAPNTALILSGINFLFIKDLSFSYQSWVNALRPIAKPQTMKEKERLSREGDKIELVDFTI